MELKLGSTGQPVIQLQQLLGSVTPDGQFGPGTQSAVIAFQRANGLEADGIVGPLTWSKLTAPVATGDTDLDAVARLAGFAGRGRYVLGAGGTKPSAPTPFTWRGAQNGSDCIGAVMWALGCPRHHDAFPEYEGDINTDSALMDAGLFGKGDTYKGLKKFFRPADKVHPGTVVIYRSVWWRDIAAAGGGHTGEHRPEDMARMGHVGLVVGWEGMGPDPEHPLVAWDGNNAKLVTVECCAAWPAVVLGRNRNFLDGSTVHGAHSEDWRVKFLEFVGPRFA